MTQEQYNYIKAINDIKQAIDSFNNLTPLQRIQVLDEVSKIEVIKEMLKDLST